MHNSQRDAEQATASHDLPAKIIEYVDVHFALTMVSFLKSKGVYEEGTILAAEAQLLAKTGVDTVASAAAQDAHDAAQGAANSDRRTRMLAALSQSEKDNEAILALAANAELRAQLKPHDASHNCRALSAVNAAFQLSMLAGLQSHAKLAYDCGNYANSAELLSFYRLLAHPSDVKPAVLWGQLAAETMAQNWDQAFEHFRRLSSFIDSKNWPSYNEQVVQRIWLAHWALFVCFKHTNGREALLDIFLQPAFLHAIQTFAPHLLRYVSAAAVLCRRRRVLYKEVVPTLVQEAERFSDPITDLLVCIYDRLDLSAFVENRKKCSEAIELDYFLAPFAAEFAEITNIMALESLSLIHGQLSSETAAAYIGMDLDEYRTKVDVWARQSNNRAQFKLNTETGVISREPIASAHQLLVDKLSSLEARTRAVSEKMGIA